MRRECADGDQARPNHVTISGIVRNDNRLVARTPAAAFSGFTFMRVAKTYQPDILILLTESFSKMQENKIEGAPDLIVEVLSPSTAYYDLKHKKSIYEKQGVKEYWVVDPIDKTVEIYQNQNAKFHLIAELTKTDTAKSQLIAGMEVELEKIF
jgi:Uma2 family endonuclease